MPSNAASLIIILNKNYALKKINEGISTAIMNLSGLRTWPGASFKKAMTNL